ncbi:MAG TPA: hypothetical protein VFS39_11550 [Nitrospira sp.]|nr:hypothetical protein [Nitrospira sp.]
MDRKRPQHDRRQKMRSNYRYRGRIITLMPRLEGYMWACDYVIRRSGRTEIDGSPGTTYFSREEAEGSALFIARTFIDQCELDKDPLRN